MRFQAELTLGGKTATGIAVPESVIEGLGGGRRPRVAVSFNGYSYQITLGTMAGTVMIPVSATVRTAAGVKAGDQLDVEIELATEPEVVEVPEALAKALAADPDARAFFEGMTASQRRNYGDWIGQAKQPETQRRRLERAMTALRAHQTRW